MPDQRGWKLKIGAVVPSTNTIVQPDFDDLRPNGVTNHIARISIPNMSIRSDDDFDRMEDLEKERDKMWEWIEELEENCGA